MRLRRKPEPAPEPFSSYYWNGPGVPDPAPVVAEAVAHAPTGRFKRRTSSHLVAQGRLGRDVHLTRTLSPARRLARQLGVDAYDGRAALRDLADNVAARAGPDPAPRNILGPAGRDVTTGRWRPRL